MLGVTSDELLAITDYLIEELNLTKYDLVEDIKEIVNRYDILKEDGYIFTLNIND